MLYSYYLEQLGNIPKFLKKYLKAPSLERLKNIDYFCGMNHSSSNVYNFKEYVSRYDHSLSVALLVYKLTKDKIQTIAGLFHDISTPCFSHVIDYMNKDYANQESTEEYTESIIKSDTYLVKCLTEDGIVLDQITNFKKYSIVDNKRPRVCADRLDGIILTGICLLGTINKKDIKNILETITIFSNEDKEVEIGFTSKRVATKVFSISESIDKYFHSKEDNYMMELLASITRFALEKGYILYEDLYKYNEKTLFEMFNCISDKEFQKLLKTFKNIKVEEIPKEALEVEMSDVKPRDLNPLVNGKRLKEME